MSIVLSFLLGLIIAVMRMSHFRPVRWFAHGYLEFFRNTPLLVQIFFWYFGSYKLLPDGGQRLAEHAGLRIRRRP